MNSSYRLWLFRWYCGCLVAWLVAVAAFTCASMSAATAQTVSSQAQKLFTIHGIVDGSDGKPVADVSVRLESTVNHSVTVTMTDAQGVFAVQATEASEYLVSAEKAALHSKTITIAASQGQSGEVKLVLDVAGTASTDSGSVAPASNDAMAFADKPDFTVAGITDWTAAGGHGSDVGLRTSESLTRAAIKLDPEKGGGNTSGSNAAINSEKETQLRAALAKSPESFEANHRLGEFCLQAGHSRDALSLLETAFKLDPSNRENEYDLAVAEKETGDIKQASDLARKLLVGNDDAKLHRMLGDLDEASGDSLAAINEYERAVRIDPSEQNYFLWGSELLVHRAVRPAVEVFEKGADAYPHSARMLAALGAAFFANGSYSEAALRLCAASDLNSADSAPYIFLGKIDMAAPDALACVKPKLKRFAEDQPNDARANYYYAMAIWKREKEAGEQREMQVVEQLLTKATEVDRSYADAYLQLGNFCSEQRDFAKAIGFYTEAIELNPQLGDAHFHLGMAYQRTGEREKAKHEFELHEEIEKQQAADVERQRREVKQFLIVLNGQSAPISNQ